MYTLHLYTLPCLYNFFVATNSFYTQDLKIRILKLVPDELCVICKLLKLVLANDCTFSLSSLCICLCRQKLTHHKKQSTCSDSLLCGLGKHLGLGWLIELPLDTPFKDGSVCKRRPSAVKCTGMPAIYSSRSCPFKVRNLRDNCAVPRVASVASRATTVNGVVILRHSTATGR